MEDRSRAIFGNAIPTSAYNKAKKTKKKNIRKFGDDKDVNYPCVIEENPYITVFPWQLPLPHIPWGIHLIGLI